MHINCRYTVFMEIINIRCRLCIQLVKNIKFGYFFYIDISAHNRNIQESQMFVCIYMYNIFTISNYRYYNQLVDIQ